MEICLLQICNVFDLVTYISNKLEFRTNVHKKKKASHLKYFSEGKIKLLFTEL
jgi:hypothetical protein